MSYSLLINSYAVERITLGCGLRQGDLISPYSFILCAETLTKLIGHEKVRNGLHGVKIN